MPGEAALKIEVSELEPSAQQNLDRRAAHAVQHLTRVTGESAIPEVVNDLEDDPTFDDNANSAIGAAVGSAALDGCSREDCQASIGFVLGPGITFSERVNTGRITVTCPRQNEQGGCAEGLEQISGSIIEFLSQPTGM